MMSKKSTTLFLALASLVSLVVLVGGIGGPGLGPKPSQRWRAGPDRGPLEPFAEVKAATPLYLEVDLPFPAWVYVASYSRFFGTLALFPSDYLLTTEANPLSEGRHALPGVHDGEPMSWPSHDVVGPISYVVIASEHRLPELEATFAQLRQMGNRVFADRGMYLFAPRGGMKVVPSAAEPATEEIALAIEAVEVESDGPLRPLPGHSGVYARSVTVQGR